MSNEETDSVAKNMRPYDRVNRVLDIIRETEKDYTKSSRAFCFYIHLMNKSKAEYTQLQKVHVVRDNTQQQLAKQIGMSTQTVQELLSTLTKSRLIAVSAPTGNDKLDHQSNVYVMMSLL